MKKTLLLLYSLMLITTISYGAFHKSGASLYIGVDDALRIKSISGSGATGNVNTIGL